MKELLQSIDMLSIFTFGCSDSCSQHGAAWCSLGVGSLQSCTRSCLSQVLSLAKALVLC